MEDGYNMEAQDGGQNDGRSEADNMNDGMKDFGDQGYDDMYDEDDGFRAARGRGGFRGRGRGPPPGWMNGPPPMRFRGRGYGPGGPPMRGRGYFRGRGGPRFSNPPNYEGNWGPMGPPPPGMMGGPPPFGPPPGMMPPGGPMGPPPNMMGQPPPFGGPPTMPPPNIPAPELWVETKSDDGKSYYYHARTRETTWTRPQEGPACKVVTQQEMEAMAAAGQLPPGIAVAGQAVTGQAVATQSLPAQSVPAQSIPAQSMPAQSMPPQNMMPQMMQHPPNGAPPYMTQPPPWIKDASKDGMNDENVAQLMDSDETPPGEAPLAPAAVAGQPVSNPYPGPNYSSAPPTFPPNLSMPPMGQPPQAMPGMGQPAQAMPGMAQAGAGAGGYPWGGWGGWPPPLVANPPPNLANNVPTPGAASGQLGGDMGDHVQLQLDGIPPHLHHHVQRNPPPKKEIVIPPELEAAAAEWSTHRAPDGRPYYYHAARQESVWEKPKPMKELDDLKAKIQAEKDRAVKLAIIRDKEIKKDLDIIDVEAHEQEKAAAEARAIAERERAAAEEREREERERQEKERAEREKAEKEKAEKEKAEKEKEKAKADKSRPVSSTPISGTPWCVVWTGDGRVFFYNPTAHSSVWERPPQLIGRADVDKAVSQPPQALVDLQKKDQQASGSGKTANGETKRAAQSDSDDSDSEPVKKAKTEDTTTSRKPGQIDLGKEAAIEAEVRAARERGVVPHSHRLRSFLAMLHEKQVSAFSTWEKELHKIVFDQRYLMLNSKERRQVFDQYVRERADEERKEKKNRLLQKKQAYRALMEEAKLHTKCSYTEFSSKYGRDERFKAIEKPRDRELFFTEYMDELRKRDKEEKERKREQAKLEYFALLKEKGVDRHSRFSDFKKKLEGDPRFKAVESGVAREDYFREFCKQLKDDRRKDKDGKERDRSGKKEKKEKDRDKEKDKESKKEKKSKKEAAESEQSKAEEPEAEAEEGAESGDAAAREREARAQASIKEREREVQRALATSLRDRDKEREHHKRDEAVQHFTALLADLVRNPELSWREAKKQLKKDHRYSLADLLSKEDKERLFAAHTGALAGKRRDKLRAVLDALGVAPTAHWRAVRDQLRADPATPAYASEKQMEREFRDYLRDKQSAAKTAFRQLLAETRAITHRSLAAVRAAPAALQQIHDAVSHSARYTALDHIPEEREAIMMSYLEELDKKGPPPPPTATEPSRRAKQ